MEKIIYSVQPYYGDPTTHRSEAAALKHAQRLAKIDPDVRVWMRVTSGTYESDTELDIHSGKAVKPTYSR